MQTLSVQLDNKTKVQWNVKPLKVSNVPDNVKIQARSDLIYNPCLPTRQTIREENYKRRLRQMTEEGFKSANSKPYKGIGDPFYLDYNKLLLVSLGQWDPDTDNHTEKESVNVKNEQEKLPVKRKQVNATNFILRSRKNLNNLKKEQARIRVVEQNVRFGHSLFEIIDKEEEKRKIELIRKEEDEKNKTLKAVDSSSENENVESVNNLNQHIAKYENNQNENNCSNIQQNEPRSLSVPITSNSHKNLRPYAPSTSLVSKDDRYLPPKEDFYRQLCVLNWILEAMNFDASQTVNQQVERVSSAFSTGRPTTSKKKLPDSQWADFLNPSFGLENNGLAETNRPALKKRSSSNMMLQRSQRLYNSKVSSSNNLLVPGSSRSSSPSLHYNQRVFSPRLDASISSETDRDDDRSLSNKLLHKEIDEQEQQQQQQQQQPSASDDNDIYNQTETLIVPKQLAKQTTNLSINSKRKALKEEENFKIAYLEKLYREQRDPRLAKLAQAEDRRKEVMIRATVNIRPQSSPAVLKYASSLPSNKKQEIKNEMRNKFDEISQEQALILHEAFEARESNRCKQLWKKFERLTGSQLHFHNAVKVMRSGKRSPKNDKSTTSTNQKMTDFIDMTTINDNIDTDTDLLTGNSNSMSLSKSDLKQQKKSAFRMSMKRLRMEQYKEEEKRDKRHGRLKYYDWYIDLNIQCYEHNQYSNCPLIMNELKELEKFGKVNILTNFNTDQTKSGRTSSVSNSSIKKSLTVPSATLLWQLETAKQLPRKFLTVLEKLRDWEICMPHVSQAIEFCRERIVEMPVEEYEEWFREMFPNVHRPRTAPANNGSMRNKSR